MITIGICLIYFGAALWFYQVYWWLTEDQWRSSSVLTAWRHFSAPPSPDSAMLGVVVDWFMDWPLSVALLCAGAMFLGMVFGSRKAAKIWRRRLRRKWILDQCETFGHQKWAVPKILTELEKTTAPRKQE